jgi:Zn-finger protein
MCNCEIEYATTVNLGTNHKLGEQLCHVNCAMQPSPNAPLLATCSYVAGLTHLCSPLRPEYSPSLSKAFVHGPCTLVGDLFLCSWTYAPLQPATAGVLTSAFEGFRQWPLHPCWRLVPTCSWTYTPLWPATAGRTSLRFRRPSVQPLGLGRRTVVLRPSLTSCTHTGAYLHSRAATMAPVLLHTDEALLAQRDGSWAGLLRYFYPAVAT